MNKNAFELLLSLLRYRFATEEGEKIQPPVVDRADLPALYALAKHHDLAHLVSDVLGELGVLDGSGELDLKLQKQQLLAVYRYERTNYEYQEICRALSKSEIAFLPLKGSILRDYYPAPWMRTSCDIDILVHEKDLERAVSALEQKLQYSKEQTGFHDVSLRSPSDVHLELHFDLNEREYRVYKTLTRVWDYTVAQEDDPFFYRMPNELFYFYHIAHMAKHFVFGGCGVKPFLDLLILDRRFLEDRASIDALLQKEGLLDFANACRKLNRVWFYRDTADEADRQMQAFVLHGGVYGTMDNHVVMQQNKKGGKLRYAFSRIFPPLYKLKLQFPILEKHPWLFPFCQIGRWFGLIFKKGRLKSSVRELSMNTSLSKEQIEQTSQMLSRLGL